jgi:MYXO-CTERM domain-containing protein
MAVNACSSEPGAPSGSSPSVTDSGKQTTAEHEVAPSLAARDHLARVTQFKRFFMPPKATAAPTPAGLKLPAAPAPKLEPEPRPVVAKGDAERFIQQGERIRAQVSDKLKSEVSGPATVDLPKTAGGFVRLQPDSSTLGIEFAVKGVKADVAFENADGLVNYPGAAPGGADVVLRVTADAVEDYVVLNEKPAQPFVDYAVNVSEIAGLRLIENSLEFLTKDGNPIAKVRPPELYDADGTNHHAKLSVLDCATDTSSELPWNRPVTAPGAAQCTLRVSWSDAKVVYPAIVDPVWATAKSLTFARYRNAAVKSNLNGFVITCGGIDNNGDPLKTCEAYNHGTDTWAAAATMKFARAQFTLLALGNDVLAVGDSTLYTSELLSGGVWTSTLTDFSAGSGFLYLPSLMPAVTADGAWVVLLDYNGKPYRYQVSAKAWTTGTTNNFYRQSYEVLTLPGGTAVMRCGGTDNSGPALALKTCEKYTPSTDTWIMPGAVGAIANMNAARSYAAWATLDATSIMLYGGYNPVAQSYINTAEVYNSTANTWTNLGSSPSNIYEYNLHNTWALHSGAGRILSISNGVNSYDPVNKVWSQINTYDYTNVANPYFYVNPQDNAVASAGTKVLVVPVTLNGAPGGAQTTCKLFDVGAKGAQCNSTGECGNGLTCAKDDQYEQGYCCDTACSELDPCQACYAGNKQSANNTGTCGPRSTNSYIGNYLYKTHCVSSGTTCGTVGGYCDGAGACMKASTSTYCGNGSCASAAVQNNVRYCDGKGACAAQTTTDCTTGYVCIDAYQSCIQPGQCNDDSYCTSTYYCQFWQNPYYTCQPKKANGATCSYATECTNGHCVDGVCCDLTCDGTCEACTNALTGKTTGNCKPIAAGADPQFECNDNGAGNCGQNGSCNGAGACQLYALGTVCQGASCATSTSRNIPDTCNGTGTCTDGGTQACATGYACLAGVCQTSCTDDTACASGSYCDTVAKQCVPDKTQGQACPRDSACAGNANCVDGVCCDSACTGSCRSCLKNRTGLSADGTCGNTLDDTDPENECAIDVGYPASCKAPGTCDGQGACRVYAKVGVVAKANVCSTIELTQTTCDGAGNLDPRQTPCYPYKCNAAGNGCRVACTKATAAQDCDASSFCGDSGTCIGQKADGIECMTNAECKNGHCANVGKEPRAPDTGAGGDGAGGAAGDPDDTSDAPGVCCDTACDNDCEACKKSIKGEGVDGECKPVKDHTDPAGDCGVVAPCGHNGECDGERHCRNVPGGTACGVTSCVGNAVQGQRCDGLGACIDNDGTTACAPYVCREVGGAEQCTNPCADDNDCSDGYYCSEMACKKKLANGKTCDSSGICNSGFCVDGLCCDVSCNGQCEACDSPGNEGVCTAVKGDPHGTRPQCDHAGEECGGQCDGVNAATCKYKPNGDTCGTPTCDNDLAKSSACNGQGECKANKNTECSPYTCGTDDVCLERCEQDADCSQGYACDETTQRCLPSASAATCSEDRLVSQGQNGADTPCKPFLCVPASGTCAVSCAFTTDCSPDFVCEPSTKTCLPAPADGGGADDTSCACRAAGAAPKSSGYLALAALGVALTGLRRRKRSRKPALTSAKPASFAAASQPSE